MSVRQRLLFEASRNSAFPRETAKSPAECCEIQSRETGLEEGLRSLYLDRPELVGVKTEQLQGLLGRSASSLPAP